MPMVTQPASDTEPGVRRRWPARLAAGALAAVAVWAVLVGLAVAGAWSDLRSGRQAALALRGEVDDIGAALDDRFGERMTATAAHFRSAERRLDAWWMAPARLLPVAGRQIRSARALSASTADILGAVDRAREAVNASLEDPLDEPAERLAAARQLQGTVDELLADLRTVDLGPDEALVGSLADARFQLETELVDARQQAERASTVLGALADLMEGPRTLAVFASNNAEMRAGAGMFLSAGVLHLEGGEMRLDTMRSVTELPQPTGVELTGGLATHWSWLEPQREWRNLMLSPRFPESAELARRMWAEAGLGPVDGVVTLDVIGLKELLTVVGPVDVDDRVVDSAGLADLLLHDQYVEFGDLSQRDDRRDLLARIADAVFEAVDGGRYDYVDLVKALARSAVDRHVMIWSAHEAEQQAWSAVNAAGELQPDSMMLSLINRSVNKVDPFLKVEATVDEQAAPGGGRSFTVRVEIANTTPAWEPSYITGRGNPAEGLQPGDHRGLLVLSLPAASDDVSIEGVESPTIVGEDGPTVVIGHAITAPVGERARMTFRFSVPADLTSIRVKPSARVPATQWTWDEHRWRDHSGRSVTLSEVST